MNCINCTTETTNPKFCSRSCSASYTNKVAPKRQITEKFCKRCGGSLGVIPSGEKERRICDGCKIPRTYPDINEQTKGDLKGQGNANRGGRYPYIRTLSRRAYINSGKGMECAVCGYSLHVDVCHVKDVKSFPDSATVAEINDIDNLIALCKNHHWEFDNGYLDETCCSIH